MGPTPLGIPLLICGILRFSSSLLHVSSAAFAYFLLMAAKSADIAGAWSDLNTILENLDNRLWRRIILTAWGSGALLGATWANIHFDSY